MHEPPAGAEGGAARGSGDSPEDEGPPRWESATAGAFARRVGLTVTIAAGAALLLALLVLGVDILLAAFAGVLFATLLRALTLLFTENMAIPDGAALALVLVLLVAFVGGAGWLLAPSIADEVDELGEQLPGMVDDLEALLRDAPLGERLLNQARQAGAGEMALGALESMAATIPDWLYYALTAFFVGIFGAANPVLYRQATSRVFPLRHRARVLHLLEEIGYTLRWWLLGQAASMVLIGASVGILLAAFGLPLALPVGILVGLLGFVPYLGPILGIVPVALVAATAGATTFLWVMAVYVVIQNLEGYVALPLIHQKTVYLPPAFTIFIQMLLGTLLGALGFVMATPVAVVGLVMARFYRRYALDDREVESLGR